MKKSGFFLILFVFAVFSSAESAWATFTLQSQTAVKIELTGFNGLKESSIFKGDLTAGSKHEIDTPYRGLALLVFAKGQSYPVIIGDEFFTVNIASPEVPPSFVGSAENDFFYKSLLGGVLPPKQHAFALLMIQAKQLLESSHNLRTVEELHTKKQEFHEFVGKHYQSLKHSDMIKRLLAQYFMMHEYVDYHIEGAPATDIKVQFQKEVLAGVGSWLEILKPYLPEQEILNYCVSLYYNRSMVSMAGRIIDNFSNAAYCPGDEKISFNFPDDLLITLADGNKGKKLADFKGKKIIAFVSEDCPVSMVATTSKARQSARQKENVPVIVAPLEKLSSNHLAMSRMISNGNMLFINDEKWREGNLPKKIKLPLFVLVGDD